MLQQYLVCPRCLLQRCMKIAKEGAGLEWGLYVDWQVTSRTQIPMATRLGYVRLYQPGNKLGVRLGQVRLGQVRLGLVWLGTVSSKKIRLKNSGNKIKIGQIRRLGKGYVRLGQVRLQSAAPLYIDLGVQGPPPQIIFICENNRKSNKIMHCVDLFIF